MNCFRKLGFIEYNGTLSVHSSLLNVILHRLNIFLPWLREDKLAGPQTQRNLDFARNPKLSRFDQNAVLSEAHNSRCGILCVSFGNKRELYCRQIEAAIKKPAHGWKVKAVPTVTMKTMKMTDSGRESKAVYGMGQETQLPLGPLLQSAWGEFNDH